ncbi:EAL domain-containing protein [Sideroxydans lithotrophicus]|uniref:Diguanylate cyclase/phosphodiesterase n=1 Tax=Sideroxydans lithotrophicus (strain ES-1) TaxID=580332 RepID=D5CLQ4_SIDLE|nr:EAL domain-containing protein [Sideroxydans lithotrophicus]ADE12499.1 diguanylate cyclase/phosphodiesterase [Sideroxydans lithotrophicus ES-1]
MSHDDFKSLLEVRNEAELRQRAQEVVVGFGFDYFLYATGLKMENSTTSFTKVITTYPAAWIEKYVSAGYASIDPAVRHSMERRTPYIWSAEAFESAGAGLMFEDARHHGIVSGMSVPLFDSASNSIGGMGLACRSETCRGLEDIGRVVLFALYFQEAYSRIAVPFLHDEDGVLSRQEGACLGWISDGLDVAQIAQRLALPEAEVQQLLEQVLHKLDASSLPQAVAHAFAGGLLTCFPGHPVRPVADEEASLAASPHYWALREIEREIAEAQAQQYGFAVAVLDLDHFRRVNNALGHNAGNVLLAEVAERLRYNLPPHAHMTGLEGDGFLLLLPELASEQVANHLLACLRSPITVLDRQFTITASMGVVRYPQDGESAEALLRCAEISLYRAKEHGRDRVEFFAPEMSHKAERTATLEVELRAALGRDELTLYYQPLVDSHSGQIRGLEALSRWHSPLLGTVPPDQFIPVAEQSDLIRILDEWVFLKACRQLKVWREQLCPDLFMAVNVCPSRFLNAGVVEHTIATLRAQELPPECLEIEITERMLMDSDPIVRERLTELRNHGVRISIDDFGTGHSSLSYLSRLPVDVLKIDRSFVQNVTSSSEQSVLVEAIVAMAGKLGLHVVAEGVEQESEKRFLMSCGCDLLQGYLIGHPEPPENIAQLLQVQSLHPHTGMSDPDFKGQLRINLGVT